MRISPYHLARASSRHPWRTIWLWVVAVVVAGGLSGALLGGVLTTEADFTNRPEAKQAEALIEDRLRGPERVREIVIVSSGGATVDDPAFRSFTEDLRADLVALGPDRVENVSSFYDTGDPSLVSQDRHTLLLPLDMAGNQDDAADHIDAVHAVTDKAGADPSFDVLVFGGATLGKDFKEISEKDLQKGESFGVLVALVILVAVFGAVVAGLVPLIMGIAAIAVAIGAVALVGQLVHFSFFVTNMITMMGLAVGIDYSLFIVSRYREERAHGRERLAAIAATGATASRAVFFSGMTVVLALLGMLLIPTTIFRSLAAGAIFVVVASVLASLTLLPALLALLGDRVNALRVSRRRAAGGAGRPGGFWDRITTAVMARPVVSLVVGAGVLLAAASSYLDIRTGFAGVSTLPDGTESKQAFSVLARDFAGGLDAPMEVVVDGRIDAPEVQAGLTRLQQTLAGDRSFGPSRVEVNRGRDLAVVSAPLAGDPSSDAAVDAVERVRRRYVPDAFGDAADVKVGGQTAFNKDFFDLTDTYTPIVFAFVLGLSFVLLMVVFRSIVVPLKAMVMNLLSVGAAYGLIVLVCQKGVGAGLLGFQQVEVVEAWIPLFLFSVLFGLSMDYHVFLLSRIREHFDHTGHNTASVAHGLRTTAGIITGAALIMVAVFGGFATGDLVSFQQMGFGLAVAVLVDATIVRSVLVPASMRLLGDRNWYLPRWLEWLPRLGVEGPPAPAPAEPAKEPAAAR